MSEPKIIALTSSAAEEIRRLKEADNREGIGLRLGVRGGGCSGLSYMIDFDTAKDNDHVQHEEGFDIFVDPKSSLYLKDTVLNYNNSLQERGFKFQNPNASNTCGCGESFSV
jgi:iron-sulfur cluster assembly protein